MADHLQQLLVAIEDVKQLASSQDQTFTYTKLALKVVEMRDHFQLEELASVFSVLESGAYITGLHLAVKRVKFIMRRCLDGGWIQAVLQNETNDEELREILIDLDQFCRRMCSAMLKNTKGDSCGQMNSSFNPREYEGFQELLETREEVVDLYHKKVLHRLEKVLGAHKSGKLKEREFIARILQKLKNGRETGDLLNLKWAEVVSGSLLGQGGNGSVMESNLFGEALAFKCLIPESGEAEIQATLHHPNIVQTLCCLHSGKKGRFLVMELMSMDLKKYLKKNEQGFALPVAIDMILQIARAIYYLHFRSVAHLDLKSSNVMVKVPDSPDEYVQVKLGDFGSAKIGLSAKAQNVGTTRYRAPEISVDPEGIEQDLAKADVYSFALTCYHILTCQEPFAGIRDDRFRKEVVELQRRPQFSKCCPPELVSLISRCWATDPMLRPNFKTICDELPLVLTRLSGNFMDKCGPTFIGEDLVGARSDDLKYGNMLPAAHDALKEGMDLELVDWFEEALAKYNEANGVQPENLYILERRGHVKRILGKLSEALDDLNEANKLDPEYADVLVERGIVRMKTGDLVGALKDLDKYITLRPDKAFGFYIRGRIKYSLDLYEEALVDFDQAQNLGRKGPSIFSYRASTKMALKDYRGAIADFDAISPSRITSDDLRWRGTSKACLGNIKGALEDYDKGVHLSPYDPYRLRARASFKLSYYDTKGAMEDSLEASKSTYPIVDFGDLVFRGQVRFRTADFRGTLKELNTVREHEAQNPNFWGFQAYQKSKVDDMKGALEDIEKAIELDSNISLHLSWRGQIKLMLGDAEGASVDFEKVRELDSGNAALAWNRALFRSCLFDHHGVLRDLNMVLEHDPRNWNALFYRGEAKRMLLDFGGALADYTEANRIDPNNNTISSSMGFMKEMLNDIDGGLAHLNNLNDQQASDGMAYLFRGRMRGVLKDYAGSLEDLNIAQRLQPYNPQILIARAHVKSELEDLEGALDDQQKALLLEENEAQLSLLQRTYENYTLLRNIRSYLISDFGNAKKDVNASTYGTQSTNVGTLCFKAPELFEIYGTTVVEKKNKHFPFKADVYSFAMLCVELLTGLPPYHTWVWNADTSQEAVKFNIVDTLSIVVKKKRPLLSADRCPEFLRNLVAACWDDSPKNRPTFIKICEALQFFQVYLCKPKSHRWNCPTSYDIHQLVNNYRQREQRFIEWWFVKKPSGAGKAKTEERPIRDVSDTSKDTGSSSSSVDKSPWEIGFDDWKKSTQFMLSEVFVHIHLGMTCVILGSNTLLTIEHFTAALKVEPDNFHALRGRGRAELRQKSPVFARAMQDLENANTEKANDVKTLVLLGRTKRMLKPPDLHGALEYLNEAYKLDPKHGVLFWDRGSMSEKYTMFVKLLQPNFFYREIYEYIDVLYSKTSLKC